VDPILAGRRDTHDAAIFADRNRAPVAVPRDGFDTGDGAGAEKRQHRIPVIGRAIGETNRQRTCFAFGLVADPPQRSRRTPEHLQKGFIEAADAVEARGQRDLGHRQRRLVDQLLGEQDPPRLRDRDRRRPDMLAEQPAQLARADAEPTG
jgi:hypothetical protein